jgi:hypothetical protein
MPLATNTIKTAKVGWKGPTYPIVSTHPSSASSQRNVHGGATCTTRRHASASLEARLRKPSSTSFHPNQAARSRRVSRVNLPPSGLLRNRQTEVHLILMPKPINRCGDFDAQITKPRLPVLRPKSGNPPSPWLCGSSKKLITGFEVKPGETIAAGFQAKPRETVVAGFEAKPPETVATSFEVKLGKTVLLVLRLNHCETVTIGFEAQTDEKPSQCFCGQTTDKLMTWF